MKNVIESLPVFAERLNELKGELSQEEFAKFLGISRQTIGFYLSCERLPSALFIKKICKKCKISSDWLIGESDCKDCNEDMKEVCKFTGISDKYMNQILKLKENGRLKELTDFLDYLEWKDSKC